MKVLGYARTSTEGQGLGLDKQEDMIKDYCFDQGYDLECVYKNQISGREDLIWVDSDDSEVGAEVMNMSSRDVLQDVLNEVKFNGVDRVIVFNPSRLARKSHYQGMLEEVFEKAGAEVEYVESSDKWIVRKILSLIDEYEVRQTIKRTTQALAQREKNDKWNGRPPTGYRVNDNGRLERTRRWYVLNKAKEYYESNDIGYKKARDKAIKYYKEADVVEFDADVHDISKSQVRSFLNHDWERISRFRSDSD